MINAVMTAHLLLWAGMFNRTGSVIRTKTPKCGTRWGPAVESFVKDYAKENPCFLIEELQESLIEEFPDLPNVSQSTICHALWHDLGLSWKVLTKRASQSLPLEVEHFKFRLKPWYMFPEQMLFVNETSKDGRSVVRNLAWEKIGFPAVVSLPFSRGKRLPWLS